MTFILDCESPESAINSLSRVFSCSSSEFADLSNSLDLETTFIETGIHKEIPFEEYVLNTFSDHIQPPLPFDKVCWFHGSRTFRGNNFNEGILPLNLVLPQVWNFLINNAPNEKTQRNLVRLKENGVPDFHYNLKAPDTIHWGPYAYLVKESLYNADELGQHNYLAIPEIVEDICNGYKAKYENEIISFYSKILLPCIVKFIIPSYERSQDATNVALCYAYFSSRNEPINTLAITCYDGNGNAISSENILNVEFQRGKPYITGNAVSRI